jgi:hypothetical protein
MDGEWKTKDFLSNHLHTLFFEIGKFITAFTTYRPLPHSVPYQASPRIPNGLLSHNFKHNHHPRIYDYVQVFEWSLSGRFPHQRSVFISTLSRTCHTYAREEWCIIGSINYITPNSETTSTFFYIYSYTLVLSAYSYIVLFSHFRHQNDVAYLDTAKFYVVYQKYCTFYTESLREYGRNTEFRKYCNEMNYFKFNKYTTLFFMPFISLNCAWLFFCKLTVL